MMGVKLRRMSSNKIESPSPERCSRSGSDYMPRSAMSSSADATRSDCHAAFRFTAVMEYGKFVRYVCKISSATS
eukprot:4276671-Amphidinium_carterae.1